MNNVIILYQFPWLINQKMMYLEQRLEFFGTMQTTLLLVCFVFCFV